jgi:ABC-2 type transport system ATP-binding protein
MAADKPVIQIKNLTKLYGKIVGVKDLNLEVFKGEIFGFLGPNGAGKTTTIRTCLDLIMKTSGEIKIFGMDSQKDSVEIRRRTGYLPGEFELIPDLKVRSFLKYFLSLSNTKSDRKMNLLSERLEVDLNRKTQELSKGNRQKVGIVQAFMADQDLIILDEPTGGLDPLMQQEFYKLIREEREEGKTIFMSSHVLAEIEAVCDRLAIIKNGGIHFVEKISTLQDKMGKVLEVEFRKPVDSSEFDLPGVTEIKVNGTKLTFTVTSNFDQVIKAVADHQIINMNLQTFSLEDLFLKYYAEKVPEDIRQVKGEGGGGE